MQKSCMLLEGLKSFSILKVLESDAIQDAVDANVEDAILAEKI